MSTRKLTTRTFSAVTTSTAFIIEVIFALPGVGRMAVNAIFEKDFPVIQAVLVVTALNVLVVNFLVDIAYAVLDPRIRIQ